MRKLLREIITIYYLYRKCGFLREAGWLKSVEKRMPVNRNGEPIPWFTISFNYYLDGRLKKEMSVFEYGSGNSTLYFSSRVASSSQKYMSLIIGLWNQAFARDLP